jgi:hypothetical protein
MVAISDRTMTLLFKVVCFNLLIIPYKHKNFIHVTISKHHSIITKKKKYQGLYSTIIWAETVTQHQHANSAQKPGLLLHHLQV